MKAVRICVLVFGMLCTNILSAHERDIVIKYSDRQGRPITLAGTLTMPEGKAPKGGWPAMVLITGSGSQNRDEEVIGHKPFKVIAEYLAAHGIATLRCDDRGVGGSSGAFADVTPFDLVADIQAQWEWLCKSKKINPERVGLMGHSEGGMLAPIAAVENSKVAFVVMLAGPALPMGQTLLDQNRKIFTLNGVADTLVERRLAFMRDAFAATDSIAKADTVQLVKRLNTHFRTLKDAHAQGLTKEQKKQVGLTTADCYGWAVTMAPPYMRVMMEIDPRSYLPKLSCPLLALNGELDCQVDAETNLEAVLQAMEGCGTPYYLQKCIGMNHLFQHCTTGAVSEYGNLGQSPSDEVLHAIAEWLQSFILQ